MCQRSDVVLMLSCVALSTVHLLQGCEDGGGNDTFSPPSDGLNESDEDHAEVIVQANIHDNPTSIMLILGAAYDIRATGSWTDLYIKTDADGFVSPNWYMRSFESSRRMPKARWFALVCCVGIAAREPSTQLCTVIGKNGTLSVPGSITQPKELCCFANDVYPMYWNNQGAVRLRVTERKSIEDFN